MVMSFMCVTQIEAFVTFRTQLTPLVSTCRSINTCLYEIHNNNQIGTNRNGVNVLGCKQIVTYYTYKSLQ